jgi:IMP cyclohydrolase
MSNKKNIVVDGTAEFQHMTLGDVRKLLKELEQYGDETELRIAAIADNPDAWMEGVAAVSMDVEYVEHGDEGPELWITIEGE